jgi:hypothetical protein
VTLLNWILANPKEAFLIFGWGFCAVMGVTYIIQTWRNGGRE